MKKKIIIFIFLFLLFITGCSKNNQTNSYDGFIY